MANGETRGNGKKPLVLTGSAALVPIGVVIAVVLGALNFAASVSAYREKEVARETRQRATIEQLQKEVVELREELKHHVEVDAKLMDVRQRDIEISLKAKDLWKE